MPLSGKTFMGMPKNQQKVRVYLKLGNTYEYNEVAETASIGMDDGNKSAPTTLTS